MLNYSCTIENKSPIRRELTISIPPDSIQSYIEKRFEKLQKTAKIKGFRQGKVPLKLLRQYYLEDVKSDVFSTLVRESYVQALEENKILAVGTPAIEAKSGMALEEGQALTFTATVEVMPEVQLKDLAKIKLKRKSSKVTEKDVDEALEKIQNAHAEITPAPENEGPVKTGDHLEISFAGIIDGQALDKLKAENRLIEVGAKRFMEAFENALIGMKKGESKTFPLDFEKDFADAQLAGKTVQMQVTVHEFKKKQIPALDDEFAKRFKLETAAELRAKVSESLKEERTNEAQSELKEDLLKSLVDSHEFEVPSQLIQSQINYLKEQYRSAEGLEKIAERQVKASLILQKIAQEQGIKVEDADLDHEYNQIASRAQVSYDEVRKMYESNDEAKRNLKYRLKENRTIDHVLTQVKISDSE